MGQSELAIVFYKEWLKDAERWLTVKEVAAMLECSGDSSQIYKQVKKLVFHGLIRREFKGAVWRNRYRFNKSYTNSIKRLISIE